MRTLSFVLIFVAVTAAGVMFHQPTTGQAGASPVPPADIAAAALAKGDALRGSDPKRAEAFYRACLALEGAGGDAATFVAARDRLAGLTRKPAVAVLRMPRPVATKPVVTQLRRMPTPVPEVVPVSTVAAVSVSPDGVIYDAER